MLQTFQMCYSLDAADALEKNPLSSFVVASRWSVRKDEICKQPALYRPFTLKTVL